MYRIAYHGSGCGDLAADKNRHLLLSTTTHGYTVFVNDHLNWGEALPLDISQEGLVVL